MRTLGKTGLLINEVGFGGIPIQRITQEGVNIIIDELINTGVNFIDTARGYTVSETYLGVALKNRRNKFYLCTKSMSRNYHDMKKDIDISLSNLQTDYIDLYQFHNVKSTEEYNIIMAEDGAFKALVEAKEAGKVKNIGITSHNLDFLLTIIDDYQFDTIQFAYNILETKAEILFKKAKEHNVGVIVMKPLAGGMISDAKLAMKFVLNNPNVSVVIPGMDSVEQVQENTSVTVGDYSEDELTKIKEIQNEFNENFCRRCGYCLPCTAGIDIPSCFVIEGYYTRYSLQDWAVSRYNSLKFNASNCLECYECESRCPYNLPIVEKLKIVNNIFNKS